MLRAQLAEQSRKLDEQNREIATLKDAAKRTADANAQLESRARDCANELVILRATPTGSSAPQMTSSPAVPTPLTEQPKYIASQAAPEFASHQTATTGPSRTEVMTASNYFSAPDVIKRHCQSEWPADARMFNYCSEKQQEAVRILDQGRPFGADQDKWNAARVSCASEWPDDYSMRLHCEQKAR
jgi:hypothetical protein